MPRASGGSDLAENIALACDACNLHKSAATEGWDELEGRLHPLFNPRQDDWHEHFHFDGETGEIAGSTPKGRGTIARLKMNSHFQVRARRHWIRLNLYP